MAPGPLPLAPIRGLGPTLRGQVLRAERMQGICLFRPLCAVTTVAGPMAKDVESLALCLRALLSENMHRLDATVPPLPFREEVSWLGGQQTWRAPPCLIDLPAVLVPCEGHLFQPKVQGAGSPRGQFPHAPPLLDTRCFGFSAP